MPITVASIKNVMIYNKKNKTIKNILLLSMSFLLALALSCSSEEAPSEPVCGDGIVDSGEACDDGNTIDTDDCLTTCSLPSCGDGFVHSGVEACDDGNTINGDGCDSSCNFDNEEGNWARACADVSSVSYSEEYTFNGSTGTYLRIDYSTTGCNAADLIQTTSMTMSYTKGAEFSTYFVDLDTVTPAVTQGAAATAFPVDYTITSIQVKLSDVTSINTTYSVECGGDWVNDVYHDVSLACSNTFFGGYLPEVGVLSYGLLGVVNNKLYDGSKYDLFGNPVYDRSSEAERPVYLEGTFDGVDQGAVKF